MAGDGGDGGSGMGDLGGPDNTPAYGTANNTSPPPPAASAAPPQSGPSTSPGGGAGDPNPNDPGSSDSGGSASGGGPLLSVVIPVGQPVNPGGDDPDGVHGGVDISLPGLAPASGSNGGDPLVDVNLGHIPLADDKPTDQGEGSPILSLGSTVDGDHGAGPLVSIGGNTDGEGLIAVGGSSQGDALVSIGDSTDGDGLVTVDGSSRGDALVSIGDSDTSLSALNFGCEDNQGSLADILATDNEADVSVALAPEEIQIGSSGSFLGLGTESHCSEIGLSSLELIDLA